MRLLGVCYRTDLAVFPKKGWALAVLGLSIELSTRSLDAAMCEPCELPHLRFVDILPHLHGIINAPF